MPSRDLLEEYPLYRARAVSIPQSLRAIHKLPINMHCSTCKSSQTFVMQNDYFDGYPYQNIDSAGKTVWLRYTCQHCAKAQRDFFVAISEDRKTATKIGQFPAWDITGEKVIESRLGTHAAYYKRGLICESQGYGIGAYAYYRRIVEETIDGLLDDVEGLLEGQDKSNYAAALKQTKTARQTSEKIELVKELLPPILRPDAMNPLAALHEALSEGLHAESDEQCLEYAAQIRSILVFLTQQIATTADAKKAFTEGMRSLLTKKSDKNAKAK